MREHGSLDLERRLSGDLAELDDFARELAQLGGPSRAGSPTGEQWADGARPSRADASFPERINADPENAEQGLAKLVLALIDIVRRLMEKQAIRRMEAGSLSDQEIERMGETFLKLEQKMSELKASFGLSDEDLTLNLGPLGDLVLE